MIPLKLLWRELTITSSRLNNQPIAFFDSGVGGLTVFEKLKKIMPNEDFLYFGDTKNMPYGEKTKEELIEFADKIFKFFAAKNVKAVVMACNTTSSVTYDVLKDNYGYKVYPIIQLVGKTLAELPIKKIGIMATRATINSGAYEREINKHNSDIQVFSKACPGWVKIVEGKKENCIESIALIEKDLKEMLENKPEKIVLGCTHYPYLLDILSQFAPREMFIDPSVYFAENIKEDLKNNKLLNDNTSNGFEKFYVSSAPLNFKEAGSMFYEIKELPELVNL